MQRVNPLLTAVHAQFGYASEDGFVAKVVDASFTVWPGQIMVLVGPNGGGKTTLVRGILGQSAILGGALKRISPDAVHPLCIRYVSQRSQAGFLGDTVGDELWMAMPSEQDWQRVRDILAEVGLTVSLETRVTRLSGGQMQLLALAVALLHNPHVLVVDEGTSMLASESRQRVVDCILQRVQERSMALVWVTQQLEDIAFAHEVVVMDAGRLIWQGTPHAFFYGDCPSDWNVEGTLLAADCRKAETPCRRLGFTPPTVIQIGEQLAARGFSPSELPLHYEDILRGWESHTWQSN
ncbi:MAG: energy-coupling factor ABC transporter ATP-binding protein [Alicyclobacillaceae bacterium]|nr:energy-coupling factor ABC transporter ATP-binding protein [Alicyclobacillaceae bacterium]